MMKEIQRVGGKVLFEITDTKGKVITYRVFPEDGLGDANNGKDFGTIHEAKGTMWVYKKIDTVNGVNIFKIEDANHYQGGAIYGFTAPNTGEEVRVKFLAEARNALGGIKHNNPKTKPKSTYAENRPGYKADMRGKKG